MPYKSYKVHATSLFHSFPPYLFISCRKGEASKCMFNDSIHVSRNESAKAREDETGWHFPRLGAWASDGT